MVNSKPICRKIDNTVAVILAIAHLLPVCAKVEPPVCEGVVGHSELPPHRPGEDRGRPEGAAEGGVVTLLQGGQGSGKG